MAKQATQPMSPTALAEKLAGKDEAAKVAKTFVRPFLRRHFARSEESRGTSWQVTPDQQKAVIDAWNARTAA